MWSNERVINYMRCLYWNSDSQTPFGTLKNVSKGKPPGIFIKSDGDKLTYGDVTHLIACRVSDLTIEQPAPGTMLMRWTEPPAKKFVNESHSFKAITKPLKRTFLWESPPIR